APSASQSGSTGWQAGHRWLRAFAHSFQCLPSIDFTAAEPPAQRLTISLTSTRFPDRTAVPRGCGEAEEVFLVDRVQHRACRLLDDLVFECGNCERALLTISLRYVMSPRRQSPICSPMAPGVQVLDLAIEVCLVVLPCQPIHTRCGISLEGEECHPESLDAYMVEERGEPFLLSLPCDLPYAFQRL